MAECHPSKVDVAGSNPVSRSGLMMEDERPRTTINIRRLSSVFRHLWACSSMAEQRPHKALVAGSNPAGPIGL